MNARAHHQEYKTPIMTMHTGIHKLAFLIFLCLSSLTVAITWFQNPLYGTNIIDTKVKKGLSLLILKSHTVKAGAREVNGGKLVKQIWICFLLWRGLELTRETLLKLDIFGWGGSPGQVFCSPEAKVIAIALIYPGQSLLLQMKWTIAEFCLGFEVTFLLRNEDDESRFH